MVIEMKIEFIIPAYDRAEHLLTIIGSLKAQTNPNWKAHIVVDNPPIESINRVKEIEQFFINDDRIRFTYLDTRYNDWGHTPRNIGLDQATEEWVVMTGEDNYYTPLFVEEFLKDLDPKVCFIFSNMVHNWTNNQYIPIESEPKFGKIDIGCYAVKPEYVNGLRLNVKENWADWYFAADYLSNNSKLKIKKISKILYVHN